MAEGNSSGLMAVFNKLEKYNGSNNDLKSWLQKFNRCCLIANKVEEAIKGQLILLCLEGQALAVAEQLEYEKEGAQTFTEVKDRLDSVFDTSAGREQKMTVFEKRIQQVNESEDKFMLELVQLYRGANPQASNDEFQKAVKRKFMQGISPNLRRAIFVYNSDPHAVTVTYQRLLEYARSAKLNLVDSPAASATPPERTVNTVLEASAMSAGSNDISALRQEIRDLTSSFNERLSLVEQSDNVNAMYSDFQSRGRSQHRGRSRGRNRGNRGSRGGSFRGRGQPRESIVCFRCNGENHVSRNCLQRQ